MLEWLFPLTFLAAVAELVMSIFWVRGYWTFGIPVFTATRKVAFGAHGLPAIADVAPAFSGGIFPPLAFRAFDEHAIAFRESFQPRFMALNYTPLMRGIVRFNRMNSSVEATGYCYWWTIMFVALFTTLTLEADSPALPDAFVTEAIMLGFLAFILALLYLVQAIRFRSVVKEIAALMDGDVAHSALAR